MLNHILAGKPINWTDRSTAEGSLSRYLTYLSQQNSIISIICRDHRFKPLTVTKPKPERGIFRLAADPSDPNLTFYTKFIVSPGNAGADEGSRKNTGDDGLRVATVDEVRNYFVHHILRSTNKVSRLAKFVETSWQMDTDDLEHPLWRPISVRHSFDPFRYTLSGTDNDDDNDDTGSELAGYRKAILFHRMVVGLERLYEKMETLMACLFAVSRTADKGASFSPDGIDIFTANAGFIAEFVIFHRFYMHHSFNRIRNARIENVATLEGHISSRDMSSITDALASMGI